MTFEICGRRFFQASLILLSTTGICARSESARAIGRDYTIDPASSSIAISGTVYSAELNQTRPILEQGAGSLRTQYSGTIKTERGLGTIQFLAGGSIDAAVNGNWQPRADSTSGSEPADYGGRANFSIVFPVPVYFAARNLVADLSGNAVPINVNNLFDLSTTDIMFNSGSIAYRASIGTPAGNSSIVGSGDSLMGSGSVLTASQGGLLYERLTLPILSSFQFGNASATIDLTVTGQIVANHLIAASNGDYNKDGTVNAADYVVYRNSVGLSGVGLSADGNADGQVNESDYAVWRSKFGATGASGAVVGGDVAVPEASTAAMTLIGLVVLSTRRRKNFYDRVSMLTGR